MHPAYPAWNGETRRYVPLTIRLKGNAKLSGVGGGLCAALEAACVEVPVGVCLGERAPHLQYPVLTDEAKHNCICHISDWELPEDAAPLPEPAAHARPIFAPLPPSH